MKHHFRTLRKVAIRTAAAFGRDGCMQMAAALSFYALFSLPGLLYAATQLAAWVVDEERVQSWIEREAGGVMGEAGVAQMRTIMERAAQGAEGAWGQAMGTCLLLFAATTVMVQLQTALNRIWRIRPEPGRRWLRMLVKRAVSLAMVICVAVFIVTSFGVEVIASQGASAAFLAVFGRTPPGTVHALSIVVNLATLFAAFTAAYRLVPDAVVRWRDAAVGASVAAVLFATSKRLLASYFAVASVGSPFGAAGSLAVLLVWVDCSAIVFLLGAEAARSWNEEFAADSTHRPISE